LNLLDPCLDKPGIVRGVELMEVELHELFPRVAARGTARIVDIQDVAVEVVQKDGVVERVEQLSAQRELGGCTRELADEIARFFCVYSGGVICFHCLSALWSREVRGRI